MTFFTPNITLIIGPMNPTVFLELATWLNFSILLFFIGLISMLMN